MDWERATRFVEAGLVSPGYAEGFKDGYCLVLSCLYRRKQATYKSVVEKLMKFADEELVSWAADQKYLIQKEELAPKYKMPQKDNGVWKFEI